MCYTLGADHVIDYTDHDVTQQILEYSNGGVNFYINAAPVVDFEHAIPTLRNHGYYLLFSDFKSHRSFPVGDFYIRNARMHSFAISTLGDQSLDRWNPIVQTVLEQDYKVKINSILPLSKTKQAYQTLEHDKPWGKILISLDNE